MEPNNRLKTSKSALKTSPNFEKSDTNLRKSTKFDELNVSQTFHPADKDYGHMSVYEPRTTYNYSNTGCDENEGEQGGTDLHLSKSRSIATKTRESSPNVKHGDDSGGVEEPEPENEEWLRRCREFERRCEEHYREYEPVKFARQLIQQENDKDEEEH